MKKLIVLLPIVTVFIFCSAFIGIGTIGETPGEIHFIGDAGSPNDFIFEKWKFTKVDLPEGRVEAIVVELEINTSSIRTDWKELEKNIRKKKDYFYVKKFPTATVSINGAERLENNRYRTSAILTLKGVTKPVALNFTISDSPPYRIEGEGVVMRSDFKFTGGGPKEEVPIRFDVVLPD